MSSFPYLYVKRIDISIDTPISLCYTYIVGGEVVHLTRLIYCL